MKWLLDNPLYLLGVVLAVVAGLAGVLLWQFRAGIGLFGLFLLMVLGGAVSRVPQRFSGGSVGIEMCMFFTVCTAFVFGLGPAALVGVLGMGLSGYYTKESPLDLAVALAGFVAIAGAASWAGAFEGLAVAGVLYTILYDLLVCPVYLVAGHSPAGCAKFAATHIVWNYVVFRSFGAAFLSLLVGLA